MKKSGDLWNFGGMFPGYTTTTVNNTKHLSGFLLRDYHLCTIYSPLCKNHVLGEILQANGCLIHTPVNQKTAE